MKKRKRKIRLIVELDAHILENEQEFILEFPDFIRREKLNMEIENN